MAAAIAFVRPERSVSPPRLTPACRLSARQDGGCHRQLSEFCRRALIPQVAAVTRFRNAHSPRPYVSERLMSTPSTRRQESDGKRGRAPSRLAQWPAGGAVAATAGGDVEGAPRYCTTRAADGTVEVRAVGGNARLTLSASRTLAEVDYAVAIPSGSGGGGTAASSNDGRCCGKGGAVALGRDPAAEPTNRPPRTGLASRVWITRQFLVGSRSSDVPSEFSHALAAALRAASSSPPAAADAAGWGGEGDDVVVDEGFVGASATGAGGWGGGGAGEGEFFVASELPRPQSRLNHPR